MFLINYVTINNNNVLLPKISFFSFSKPKTYKKSYSNKKSIFINIEFVLTSLNVYFEIYRFRQKTRKQLKNKRINTRFCQNME